jgi:DNA/RNA-binding domain of Phe-tRNA-synthetase-like protein
MLTITATDEWGAAHPGSCVGLLEVSGVVNDVACPVLNGRKRSIEADIRSQYQGMTRPELLALPVMAAYAAYYRRFEKTYHVQLQLESIAWKGKRLPDVSPAVDANFASEVTTLVLTAGHDADLLHEPIVMDVSRPGDRMAQMNGAVKDLRPGDMIMRDARGISCSIIYGQDDASPISARSTHVLYVAYAPVGVPASHVEVQLLRIEEHLRLCSPCLLVEQRRLLAAGAAEEEEEE